jgi:hypothetical protein
MCIANRSRLHTAQQHQGVLGPLCDELRPSHASARHLSTMVGWLYDLQIWINLRCHARQRLVIRVPALLRASQNLLIYKTNSTPTPSTSKVSPKFRRYLGTQESNRMICISPLKTSSCAHSRKLSTSPPNAPQQPSPPRHGRSDASCPRYQKTPVPIAQESSPANKGLAPRTH